jgi:aspartate dehydrogenase
MVHLGIIGVGTIGSYLVKNITQEANIVFVLDQDKSRLDLVNANKAITSLSQLPNQKIDLIVETATATCLIENIATILSKADLLPFSLTAFAHREFSEQVNSLCKMHQRRIFIPHGAILGIDGLWDGRGVLETVSVTTTKNPANLDGRHDTRRTVVYEGPTRDACKLFPRNVNVHAALAIAGLGFDHTMSRIISDPEAKSMSHLIEAKAAGVEFRIEVSSRPLKGVTGAYTPESALNTLRRVVSRYHEAVGICLA